MSEIETPEVEEAPLTPKQRSDRALDHIAEILVEMGASDAFKWLETDLNGRIAELEERLRRHVLEDDEYDQRAVDRARGEIEGLRRPRIMIDTATRRLEKKDEPESEPETTTEETRYW
jgi:hypothetical protein